MVCKWPWTALPNPVVRCVFFTPCFACSKSLTCHYPGWAPQCRLVVHASLLSHPLVLSGLQQFFACLLYPSKTNSPPRALLTLKWLALPTYTYRNAQARIHIRRERKRKRERERERERECHSPANPLLINPPKLFSNIPFC